MATYPTYLVLNPIFMDQPGTSCGPRIHGVGEIVRFGGQPGSALFPMDAAARAARRAALARRSAGQRARDAMWVQRYVRGLSGSTLARFRAAEAEMEASRD
jgi:hypothetical protein